MSKVVKVCKTLAGPPEAAYLLRERRRCRIHDYPIGDRKLHSMSFNAWYYYRYDSPPSSPWYVETDTIGLLDKEQDF